MIRSISSRTRRLFFYAYSVGVLVILVAAWFALEDLEETALEMDKQAEIEHFQNRQETDRVINVQSAMLTLTYLPENTRQDDVLPVIFRGLPVPFDDEIVFMGREYLVLIHKVKNGTYYFAKDLYHFNQREILMTVGLFSLGIIIILFGYWLSFLVSGMISRPIEKLSDDILQISQGSGATALPVNYKDAELNQISSAFNHYLVKIDQMIKRERSLITMASHELRTPIAVIMGAAEVLEHRKTLNVADSTTLQRIIESAQTISANVQALLALVRQSRSDLLLQTCVVEEIVREVIAEISARSSEQQSRVLYSAAVEKTLVVTSKPLLKMLLQNLINNALSHNVGEVRVRVTATGVEVLDEALPRVDDSTSPRELDESNRSTGLGLYIVTMICEQMGWQFTLDVVPEGTLARVTF